MIIGKSQQIEQLRRDIQKIRTANVNVIVAGETGTGKELVAREIGESDGRPFVAVDSSTITSSMAESILFGHEKGAFTGAASRNRGLFEEANGGTIYFDEIGNMPLEIQAKLLRVIQEQEVSRIGSSRVISLSFRVLCATNRDLEELVSEGKFKEDLYQRLNVVSLRIPPLRERAGDLPMLVRHFLAKYRRDQSPGRLSDEAMKLLQRYSWPGNVRELSNLFANLCAMVESEEIRESDLPDRIRGVRTPTPMPMPMPMFESGAQASGAAPTVIHLPIFKEGWGFYKYMHMLEGQVLSELFLAHEGNVARMCRALRISRSQLYAKLAMHKIGMRNQEDDFG